MWGSTLPHTIAALLPTHVGRGLLGSPDGLAVQWAGLVPGRPVTGILVLEKLVLGPFFPPEKLVPQTIFSGKIGPTLEILVPPKFPAKSVENINIYTKVCTTMINKEYK